jgi:Site-specific recombinases, DNA invertase Pin homologs
MTGARHDRPGYQAMLAAAEAREFEVLLVDDLSRLSRDELESKRAIRALRFWGIRVIGVSDGIDTDRKGHKIEVGLRGLMSELYLDELADKTHRGLMGRALAGSSAGGLPFGYRVAGAGQRVIDQAQAAVVCLIFTRYASGQTPRAIAADLNRLGTPGPRGGSWCMTAIYGDWRRGIGILANPIYRGQMIWNRSKWSKDPFTGRRRRSEKPESEWVSVEHPELRIIDEDLWNAVQRRFAEVNARTQGRRNPGAKPKYLLSGLMKCGTCGASMVVVDRYRYGCAANKDRGADVCDNGIRVARARAEAVLLQAVREELLSAEAYRAFEAEARRVLRETIPDPKAAHRELAEAQRIRANLVENIRQGVVSPTVRAELFKAEGAVATAQAALEQLQRCGPTQLLPRARETWERLVQQLDRVDDVDGARAALRELLGEIRLVPEAGRLVAEMAGGVSEIGMVAGAGYGLNLIASPLRLPL